MPTSTRRSVSVVIDGRYPHSGKTWKVYKVVGFVTVHGVFGVCLLRTGLKTEP